MNSSFKTLRYILLFHFLVLLTSNNNIYSQSIIAWTGIDLEIDLPKKFTLDINLEARTKYDFGVNLYQYFPEIQLAYKINKRFDVSASYRFVRTKEDNLVFYNRNKFYANFMFDFPIKRFTIKNRARYQIQTREYIENEFDEIPDRYFRDKLEISYNINNNPIDPFISFEVFYPINRYEINTIDEYRFASGIDFPVGKQSMEIGVMYNKERFPRPEKSVIFLVSYEFSIN